MITFKVKGKCQPKQRPRITRGGHAFTPKETKEYERLVAETIKADYKVSEPLYKDYPVVAYMTIAIKIPSSYSKKKTQMALDGELLPSSKPDIDNCVKSILDGTLQSGVVFIDDAQCTRIYARKIYAIDPYAEVTYMSELEYQLLGNKEEKLP